MTPPRPMQATLDINAGTMEDIVCGRTQATPKTSTMHNAIEEFLKHEDGASVSKRKNLEFLRAVQGSATLPTAEEVSLAQSAADVIASPEAYALLGAIRRRHNLRTP